MGFMDKVKAQAEVGINKATEAGKQGQAMLDAAQAKHKADGVLRKLGAVTYAEHKGRASAQTASDKDKAIADLEQYEATYGPIAT